jgi:hypothetical protein
MENDNLNDSIGKEKKGGNLTELLYQFGMGRL